MRIVTISREFGSGGRELGKRLADLLQWDYYDSEIISAVAQRCGQNPQAVEQLLEHHGWQQFPVTYRGSIGSTAYLQSSQVDLLLKQKSVLEEIASLGKDCIIVGRNADVILSAYDPLNLFVCAQMGARIRRCMERAAAGENLGEKDLRKKILQIDKMRSRTREILTGSPWGQPEAYHLTVNTTAWPVKALVAPTATFIESFFRRNL